jgi:SAM-dependent methyltransferase
MRSQNNYYLKMNYSEDTDFHEKKNVLDQMYARFERYGMLRDFSKTNALEIGGAGGVLSGILSSTVQRVIVSDVIDVQINYGGEFPRLLKEKFFRNSLSLDLSKIEFHRADAMTLPYRDENYDLVISLNAFEHIPDPLLALKESIRVVKKGGLVYLTFDPIWTADSGSHFMDFVTEPWRHLLVPTDQFVLEMERNGASQDQMNDFRYGLNRKPAQTYYLDFIRILKSLKISKFQMESWKGCVKQELRDHPNRFQASKILKCPPEDLLLRGFCFCIEK